jgi:isopenicillin-N epimerase
VEPPVISRELWQWTRSQQVLEPGAVYFDHAGASPSLRSVLVAEYRARESQVRDLSGGITHPSPAVLRSFLDRVASFAGCNTDELAVTRGAGEGLSLAAAALKLQPGDEIVTTTHEHPAALEPWLQKARRMGATVKQVTLPSPISGAAESLGRLVSAVTPKTRVLAFAHVQYSDGVVMPVRELCQFARDRQILSVVDGAQGFGMLNFQLRELGCDLYAASFHKWMAGAHGTGALYVRPEVLEQLEPLEPHRILMTDETARTDGTEVPRTTARLSAALPHAWPAFVGTEAAVDFHAAVRRDRIEARVRELAIYARLRLAQLKQVEVLTPNAPGTWGGIVTFRSERVAAPELAERLRLQSRVVVAPVAWGIGQSGVRVSLHVFNTHDEIERLIQALQRAQN